MTLPSNAKINTQKMRRLKTFEGEDVVIIGHHKFLNHDYSADFQITDDYSNCAVKYDGKTYRLQTDGFVNILSMKEFDTQRKNFEDQNINFLFLPNFTGDIFLSVKVELDDGFEDMSHDIKLNDYILHQIDDTYGYDYDNRSIDIVLPNKTKVVEIKAINRFYDEDAGKNIWVGLDDYVEKDFNATMEEAISFMDGKDMLGSCFYVFEVTGEKRPHRKDIIKNVTYSKARELGEYFRKHSHNECIAMKFLLTGYYPEFDKVISKMKDGPFEAQLPD